MLDIQEGTVCLVTKLSLSCRTDYKYLSGLLGNIYYDWALFRTQYYIECFHRRRTPSSLSWERYNNGKGGRREQQLGSPDVAVITPLSNAGQAEVSIGLAQGSTSE